MQQNREGLTLEEWVRAAGVTVTRTYCRIKRTRFWHPPEYVEAWRAGEDPTDWRAALSAKKESAS